MAQIHRCTGLGRFRLVRSSPSFSLAMGDYFSFAMHYTVMQEARGAQRPAVKSLSLCLHCLDLARDNVGNGVGASQRLLGRC